MILRTVLEPPRHQKQADAARARPPQNTLADRHGVNAEFAEGRLLQLAIGWVIFDMLGIAAETVALVQHRGVTVGEPRAFVEMAAGKPAEPIEMRLDMAKQRLWE